MSTRSEGRWFISHPWLAALAAGATVLLVVSAIVNLQFVEQLRQTRVGAERDLAYLVELARDALRKNDYEALRLSLEAWGERHPDVTRLDTVAATGFEMVVYRRGAPALRPVVISRRFEYAYRGSATVTMEVDLAPVYQARILLWLRMAAAAVAVGLLFAYVLLLHRRASEESKALREKHRELQEANDRLKEESEQRRLAEEENLRLVSFPQENPNPVLSCDINGRVVYHNPAARRLWQELGFDSAEQMLPRDHFQRVYTQRRRGRSEYAVGDRLFLADYYRLADADLVYIYLFEITQRVAAERELAAEKERAQITLESIGDGVLTAGPEGRVEYINSSAELLTGWDRDGAVGQPLDKVLNLIEEESGTAIKGFYEECTLDNRVLVFTEGVTLIRADNARFAVNATAAPIRNAEGVVLGVVVVIRDVSHERELQSKLLHQASHDALTGLANRNQFETKLRQALRSAHAADKVHAVLYLDLDQFKVVNDTCGHVAGDELLRQLGGLFQGIVRSSDTLARLGGDEFGVLLEECGLERASQIAEQFRNTVREFRFVWSDRTFELGASIGVVAVTESSRDQTAILSAADSACYAAKDSGRNRVHVFQEDDKELARRHGEMQWVSRLAHALGQGRFVLFGQRIEPVRQGEGLLPRVEVLLRMVDEDDSLIPPGAFIPAAERYNLMGTLDRWVIQNLFVSLAEYFAASGQLSVESFAVNLSGASLSDPNLLLYIRDQFQAHSIPPALITFEITETAAIGNLTQALELIRELKAMGCRFALDDFGSGLSSFGYLKNLPVDYLKIDGSFVRDLGKDPWDRAMVEAIHGVGRVMGLATIAEFVEDEEILNVLREIGIDYAQGFGIARPEPLADLLHAGRSQPALKAAR